MSNHVPTQTTSAPSSSKTERLNHLRFASIALALAVVLGACHLADGSGEPGDRAAADTVPDAGFGEDARAAAPTTEPVIDIVTGGLQSHPAFSRPAAAPGPGPVIGTVGPRGR